MKMRNIEQDMPPDEKLSVDSGQAELRLLRDRIIRLEVRQEELISIVKRERSNLLDFREKIFLFLFVIFAFLCSVLMMQDDLSDSSDVYEQQYSSYDEDISRL
jgi:hypothetical protein